MREGAGYSLTSPLSAVTSILTTMTKAWTRDDGNCLLILSLAFSISLLSFALVSVWVATTLHSIDARGSRAGHTLKFVIVVTRHGNRGTLMSIPNDPYPINDTNLWPNGQGGLTPHGRVQMYNMGANIRNLYHGFLDPKYDTKDFYASSTAIDRTLLSGEAFLDGLYQPIGPHHVQKKFRSQLIPLYSNSPDKTLEAGNCAKVQNIRETTEKKFNDENTEVLKGLNEYLSEHSGINTTGPTGFFPTWDTMMCQHTEGYALPSWMQQIFPYPLEDLAGKYYIEFVAGTNELVRLMIGDFFEEILGIMKSKIEGTLSPDRKMHFYSGHDFSLITLQAILGIPKSSIIGVVKPGSAMVFELHQDQNTKELSIQVLYIDGSSKDLTPRRLPIPNGNFLQLVNNTQRFTNLRSYQQECETLI